MRFIAWNVGLATLLLLSAGLLPHSARSFAVTAISALVIGTVAIAAPGVRGLRVVNAVLALGLACASLLMVGVSWPARLANMSIAAMVLVLALVPGRSTIRPRKILWLAWRNPSPPPRPDPPTPPDGGPAREDGSVRRADRC